MDLASSDGLVTMIRSSQGLWTWHQVKAYATHTYESHSLAVRNIIMKEQNKNKFVAEKTQLIYLIVKYSHLETHELVHGLTYTLVLLIFVLLVSKNHNQSLK